MAKAETHSLTIDLCLDRSEHRIEDWANTTGFSRRGFTDQACGWLGGVSLVPIQHVQDA